MRDHVDEYLRSLNTLKNVSENTITAYSKDLIAFVDHLEAVAGHSIAVREITPRWIRRYIGLKMQEGLTAATCARKLSAIKSYFRHLADTGVIEHSPAQSVESPKLPRKTPDLPSEKSIVHLLDSLAAETDPESIRDRALIELLYDCGLRISEAISLDLDDVNTEREWLRVMGKGSKVRDIPLIDSVIDALWRWRIARDQWVTPESGTAFFLGKRGKRMHDRTARTIVDRRFREYGEKTGVHPHSLRHACATHLLDHDAGIKIVGDLLGHSSLSTTQIYTRLSKEKLKSVYKDHHPRNRE